MIKKFFIVVFILFTCSISYANQDTTEEIFDEPKESKPIHDPLEGLNRKIYGFNSFFDKYAIKPITVFYKNNTPGFLQTGVSNFVNYLEQPFYIVNYSLQGNSAMASEAAGRFLVNTIGLGIIDFASSADIPNEKTDFGETFGVWGVGEGPYVVFPIIGGATLRDNVSKVGLEMPLSIENGFSGAFQSTTIGLKILDKRKNLLSYDEIIENNALDEYSFVRDSIIQNKRYKIESLQEK